MNFKEKFIRWFSSVQLFPFPLWLTFGGTAYKVKGPDYRAILSKIKEGDILLRNYKHYVTGFFMGGDYTHVGYYAGFTMECPQTVIHAVFDGVKAEDIFTFLRCDEILVLRPALTTQEICDVTYRIKTRLNDPYDFSFNFTDDKSVSCSELIYHGFELFKNKINMRLKTRLGKPTITPDDLRDILCRIIYDSKELKDA